MANKAWNETLFWMKKSGYNLSDQERTTISSFSVKESKRIFLYPLLGLLLGRFFISAYQHFKTTLNPQITISTGTRLSFLLLGFLGGASFAKRNRTDRFIQEILKLGPSSELGNHLYFFLRNLQPSHPFVQQYSRPVDETSLRLNPQQWKYPTESEDKQPTMHPRLKYPALDTQWNRPTRHTDWNRTTTESEYKHPTTESKWNRPTTESKFKHSTTEDSEWNYNHEYSDNYDKHSLNEDNHEKPESYYPSELSHRNSFEIRKKKFQEKNPHYEYKENE
jgi:hypothetical protein